MPLDNVTTRTPEAPAKPPKGARVAAGTKRAAAGQEQRVVIEAPRLDIAAIRIVGISPYVQHKFSARARGKIEAQQRLGERAKKGSKREPRDFETDYHAAMYLSREGWRGIPAPAFRNAMISACKVAGFQMTRAKLSIFVEPDGFDAEDGTPLVRILGEPQPPNPQAVRNETGVVDLRVRPTWFEWSAIVQVRWDSDQFSVGDIVNLMARAGLQVGIGEGRPDSKKSNGLGWGRWEVAEQ